MTAGLLARPSSPEVCLRFVEPGTPLPQRRARKPGPRSFFKIIRQVPEPESESTLSTSSRHAFAEIQKCQGQNRLSGIFAIELQECPAAGISIVSPS
jgi:hypothetical protein